MAKQKTKLAPWQYQGLDFTEPVEGMTGFVYEITCETDATKFKYIGQKHFWSKRAGTKKRYQSDWKQYASSNTRMQQFAKDYPNCIERKILQLCETKSDLAIHELLWQLKHNAFQDERYLNAMLNLRINTKYVQFPSIQLVWK